MQKECVIQFYKTMNNSRWNLSFACQYIGETKASQSFIYYY